MDQKGYLNKGQIHIKATLESDSHKSTMVEISETDTIATLKKRIGEIMESNYELYRNLRGLQATKIIKKSTNTLLLDHEVVAEVLLDSEEIVFELESFDLWLTVVFNMLNQKELVIYGSTEFRIEKSEKLHSLKKKLQKFSINLWTKMLKGDGTLYMIDQFELKTGEDDVMMSNKIPADVIQNQSQTQTLSNQSPQGRQGPLNPGDRQKSQLSPDKKLEQNSPPKRKLLDLRVLSKQMECQVGELFGYKNRIFLKIVYIPIMLSSYHRRLPQQINTNVSDDSVNSEMKPLQIKSSHNTMKPSGQRSSMTYLIDQSKNLMVPTTKNVLRLSGAKKKDDKNNNSGIQLSHMKSVNVVPSPSKPKSRAQSINNQSTLAGNPIEYQLINHITYGNVFVYSKHYIKDFVDLVINLQGKNPPLRRQATLIDILDKQVDQRQLIDAPKIIEPLLGGSGKFFPKRLNSRSPRLSLKLQQFQLGTGKKSMFAYLRNSSSGKFSRTPRIKRQLRKYSSVDSSISSKSDNDEDEDDDDDDDFDEEDDDDDDDEDDPNNFDASVSYEFTKFMEDPNIKQGVSKHSLLGSKVLIPEYKPGMSMKIQRHTDLINIQQEEKVDEDEENYFDLLNDELKSSQNLQSGLQLIRDTTEMQKPEEFIKTFVISWEEAYFLKMPRLRKDNVRTNLKDFNHQNENDMGNFDDMDLFFDEEYNNRYNDKLLQLEYEEHHIQRKRRIKVCLIVFAIIFVVFLIVGGVFLYFNLYGVTDYTTEVYQNFKHLINELFRNNDEISYSEEQQNNQEQNSQSTLNQPQSYIQNKISRNLKSIQFI